MGRASVRPVPRSRRKGLDGRASRREELCLDVIDPLLATSPDRGRDLPDRARRSRRTSRRESHSGLAAPAAALPAVGSPFLGSGLRGAHGVQSSAIRSATLKSTHQNCTQRRCASGCASSRNPGSYAEGEALPVTGMTQGLTTARWETYRHLHGDSSGLRAHGSTGMTHHVRARSASRSRFQTDMSPMPQR